MIDKLDILDFPDAYFDTDNRETIIEPTRRNFQILIDEHNKLVDVVNQILDVKVMIRGGDL